MTGSELKRLREHLGEAVGRPLSAADMAKLCGLTAENADTVRRWEERGLLHAVRLPSGVRRFRPDDVEAVREQMFSGFAPLRADDDIAPVRARSID